MKKFLFVLFAAVLSFGPANLYAVTTIDRGLSTKDQSVFIPKGSTIIGSMVSYRNLGSKDFELAAFKDLNFDAYTFSASPYLFFAVSNNNLIGIRGSYKRNLIDLGKGQISLGDDMNFDFSDMNYLGHSFSGELVYRSYIPFLKSKIFALFSDVSLLVEYSQQRSLSGENGSYTTMMNYGLVFAPGLCIFMTNCVAVEVSCGLLGVNYKTRTQERNRTDYGSTNALGAHFSVDYLSAKVGLSFVLPSNK